MHIHTFKVPTTRQVGQFFNVEIKLSLIISRMLIYIFLYLGIKRTFYGLFSTQTLSVEGFAIWACYGP